MTRFAGTSMSAGLPSGLAILVRLIPAAVWAVLPPHYRDMGILFLSDDLRPWRSVEGAWQWVAHVGDYAILLALLWFAAGTFQWCREHPKTVLAAVLIATAAFVGSDEWHQTAAEDHEDVAWDLSANLIGVMLGAVAVESLSILRPNSNATGHSARPGEGMAEPPTTRVDQRELRGSGRSLAFAVKRLIDIAVSAIALALLSPLFAAVAIAIKLDSRGPVLFRHERAGRFGRPFLMYKFRSMHATPEAAQRTSVLQQDDHVITRVGRVLRATSLDELPQLINVIKGDMSLVGPRPALVSHLSRYDSIQIQRLDVRPGMTGWAQVNGRNSLTWDEKIKADLFYVRNYSLLFDFKILVRTPLVVLSRGSVYGPSKETNQEAPHEPAT